MAVPSSAPLIASAKSTTSCGRTRRWGCRRPSQVYSDSPRPFPARVPEVEYPSAMQVRKVGDRGEISWRHQPVFLTEVLIGEPVGLLQLDDRYWQVYFLDLPIACFDSGKLCMLPLPQHEGFVTDEAGEEGQPPSPAPHPPTDRTRKCQVCARSKMSGISPAVHGKKVGAAVAATQVPSGTTRLHGYIHPLRGLFARHENSNG